MNKEQQEALRRFVSGIPIELLRPTYILESESWGSMRKLVPDNHGGWTLFKCRGGDWEWDDSICDDSGIQMMEQAEKVYMSR